MFNKMSILLKYINKTLKIKTFYHLNHKLYLIKEHSYVVTQFELVVSSSYQELDQ